MYEKISRVRIILDEGGARTSAASFDDELPPTAECVRSKLREESREQWDASSFFVEHVGP